MTDIGGTPVLFLITQIRKDDYTDFKDGSKDKNGSKKQNVPCYKEKVP